jgi:hypothetical protein
MHATSRAEQLAAAVETAVWSRMGHQEGAEVRFLAPCHDDHHPSARWNPEKQAWYCDRCGIGGGLRDLAECLSVMSPSWRGNQAQPQHAAKGAKPANRQPSVLRAAYIGEVWRSSLPVAGTPCEVYLRSRGFDGAIPCTLRYAVLSHRPTESCLPCMVAAVTVWPDRIPVALHRTYLQSEGTSKATVTPCRMALGPIRGGAVRLAPADRALAVAEGIETALSIQHATGMPSWAVLSASNLDNLVLPTLPLAAEIVIGADADPAGMRAAYAAADHWTVQGRRVRIAIPPDGSDCNDVLRGIS